MTSLHFRSCIFTSMASSGEADVRLTIIMTCRRMCRAGGAPGRQHMKASITVAALLAVTLGACGGDNGSVHWQYDGVPQKSADRELPCRA